MEEGITSNNVENYEEDGGEFCEFEGNENLDENGLLNNINSTENEEESISIDEWESTWNNFIPIENNNENRPSESLKERVCKLFFKFVNIF